MEFYAKNVEETYKIAKDFASTLKPNDIVLLNGDLGAGKTTFTKGIAKALGIESVITSPTFNFMKEYTGGRIPLYHFDMYRVSCEDELYELGLHEYLNMDGVCVIEWNKFENLKNPKIVEISVVSTNKRRINILW